jgi:hypothetical protein
MEIAVGLLLNVLFWVVMVSVAVFLLTWLSEQLFPVTRQRWLRVRKEISHPRSKEASSRASFTVEEEETKKKRHRKAA